MEWFVAVGDAVVEDDPLLSVMTDKATVEIPSPVSGTVTALTGDPAISSPSVRSVQNSTSKERGCTDP